MRFIAVSSGGSSGIQHVLLEAFLIFLAAKLLGQLFVTLKQPEIVGELLAGIVLGPALLGWIHLGEFQTALADLGVVFLLFTVGLETRFSDLRAVGRASVLVALLGIALPFLLGAGTMHLLGYGGSESLLVGVAMVATSVGVTAAVLSSLGRLQTKSSRVILGAAVIDDILGLVLLAVVAGAVAGTISAGSVIATVVTALGFVAFLAVVGTRLVARYPQMVDKLLPDKSPLVVGLILCLGLSALAAKIGLAAIIGAFMAGMMLAEAGERYELDRRMKPINELLVPFFFVLTGARVDLNAFAQPKLLILLGILTVLATIGKVIAGVFGARSLGRRSALIVGVGMVPRGEVGVIVATLALASRSISVPIYSVIVGVSVLTTLIAPPLLTVLVRSEDDDT